MENETRQREPTLPLEFGKSPILRLTTFYAKILRSKMGTEPTIDYPIAGTVFKRLLKTTSELQIAILLMAHCNYRSIHDNKDWLSNTLRSRMYPLTMLGTNINVYKMYLINEKRIEYDDIDQVKSVLYNYIETLT